MQLGHSEFVENGSTGQVKLPQIDHLLHRIYLYYMKAIRTAIYM